MISILSESIVSQKTPNSPSQRLKGFVIANPGGSKCRFIMQNVPLSRNTKKIDEYYSVFDVLHNFAHNLQV
jgi:hypothetical protein